MSGMERTLTVKSNYFAENYNYKIYLILTDGKDKDPAFPLSSKITVINLDINYDKIWGKPFFKQLVGYLNKQIKFRKRLTQKLHEIKPDITISMLRRDINFITKIHDGSKKVGELHFNKNNYRDFNNLPNLPLRNFFAKLWMHQLVSNLKRLDQFVVLSHEDKEQWSELKNVAVIYNPLPEFPEKVSDCSNKIVVAAGRFVHQKGFDMLIDAWQIVQIKHPDWILKIYGNGNKEEFYSRIENNNCQDTCFLYDAVSDLSAKLVEGSIFAFSSRFEGFGMVITEAMACGVPPVAFACPCGPVDIISDGVNGLLVPPNDIEALADKINYLIENEDCRKEMGKLARKRAERFKIETIAEEWNILFQSLINKN
ncbi:MAG: glycosyltransferase family 4 protein [Bacteroidales bacterium]|nr:glycosyltransferase family 4 protein [Bacteroidales bacterium]